MRAFFRTLQKTGVPGVPGVPETGKPSNGAACAVEMPAADQNAIGVPDVFHGVPEPKHGCGNTREHHGNTAGVPASTPAKRSNDAGFSSTGTPEHREHRKNSVAVSESALPSDLAPYTMADMRAYIVAGLPPEAAAAEWAHYRDRPDRIALAAEMRWQCEQVRAGILPDCILSDTMFT